MEKPLGILPYIYFYDEPLQLGSITLFSLPNVHGRNFAPKEGTDREYLHELIECFPVSRGLKSDKGGIRAFAYFLVENEGEDNAQIHIKAKKDITLLRYMILRPDNQGLNDIETSTVYSFELPPTGDQGSRIYHGLANFNQEEWVSPAHQKFSARLIC
jgi:hypothetical protein